MCDCFRSFEQLHPCHTSCKLDTRSLLVLTAVGHLDTNTSIHNMSTTAPVVACLPPPPLSPHLSLLSGVPPHQPEFRHRVTAALFPNSNYLCDLACLASHVKNGTMEPEDRLALSEDNGEHVELVMPHQHLQQTQQQGNRCQL